MVAAPKVDRVRVLRFWSDSREPYTEGHIRIEWTDKDGILRTSVGRYYLDDNCVVWDYEEPKSNRVYNDAAECAASAGDFTVVGPHGVIEFAGVESYAQMCEAVESTCCACGTRCSSPIELSRDGECARCFVRKMSTQPCAQENA